MRRLIAIILALGLIVALPGAVAAAPPDNDLPDGAFAIQAIPASIDQDTTGADVGTDDVGCGAGGVDQATVWYTFTAAADVDLLIDASESDYSVGINVFGGSATYDTLIDCFGQAGSITLTAGELYYLMFADADEDAVNGGSLLVTLDVAPPPISLSLSIDPVAKFDPRAGTARVGVTMTCDRAAIEGGVEVNLRQAVGRFTVHGSGWSDVACGPDPATVWVEVQGDNGSFAGGRATASAWAWACDSFSCGDAYDTASVRFRR